MIALGLFGAVNTHKFKWGYCAMACYAGLDIAAKVFFGWAVMAMYPVISTQQDNEVQE